MYWLRLRDALREGFSAVRAGLGDARFDALAAGFLRAHPSTHFSLDRFGAPFASFLRGPEPAWADVAALEWARGESFLCPDGATAPFEALQAIPPAAWGEVHLRAQPSVRCLGLANDPLPTLRAQREGRAVEAPGPAAVQLVVWRRGFTVFHAPVSGRELEALQALEAGAPLVDVLTPFGEDAPAAFEALRSWFDEGMVGAVSRVAS
jgi:hypothetical protein